MEHTIDGRICARVCPNAEVPIRDASIRVYRAREDDVARDVSARQKESFRVLDDGTVEEKEHRHIEDFDLDGDGCYVAPLLEELDYQGEALQLDLRVEAIDGTEIDPVQATLTTIQPSWEPTGEEERIASWDCCLTETQWCDILEAAGYYVVAGRVTNCETEEPIDGLTVYAKDVDIIQHDSLGSDTTNANGVYTIYYPRSMLEATPSPWPDLELFGGPDLYFRIESPGGTVLLDEDSDEGRQPGRENAGRCHCEDLCVDFRREEEGDDPLFTHVGHFNIVQDIGSGGTTNRARRNTAGPDWGFHDIVTFEGFVPETHPTSGKQMYYRFRYRDANGNTHPIAGDLVHPVSVGGYQDFSLSGPLKWVEVWVANAADSVTSFLPTDKVVPTNGNPSDVDNGWVEVPDVHGAGVGHGPLLKFDTRNAVSGGSGGSATPTTGPSTPKTGEQIEVIFETTVDDGNGNPDTSQIWTQSETVALYVNNHAEVREIGLVDGGNNPIGCEVTDTAVVQYNVDHEFLHRAHVSMTTKPQAKSGVTLPSRLDDVSPSPPGNPRQWKGKVDLKNKYDGSGGYTDFDDWKSCSYITRVHSKRALTNGYREDDGDSTAPIDGTFYLG